MLGHIFLTSCLVMMTSCWRIDVSEQNVTLQHTSNVKLECRNDDNNPKLEYVSRIVMLKRNPNNQMIKVAQCMPPARVWRKSRTFEVTGKAHNLSDSFIKLHHALATKDTIGQFVCKVYGYDVNDNLGHVETRPVVIGERIFSNKEIHKALMKFKKETKTAHVKHQVEFGLLQNSTSTLLMKLTDRVDNIGNDQSKFAESFVTKEEMKNISVDINKEMQQLNKELLRLTDLQNQIITFIKPKQGRWPKGEYSLLKPNTGCPYSPSFSWDYSSVRLTTKPGPTNIDAVSNPTYLPKALQHETNTGRHYVFMTLCSEQVSSGPDWPRGTYCVHEYGNCPSGFTYNTIKFGRYSDGTNKDVVVNHEDIHPYDTHTEMCFCCRKDGKANDPMILPTESPFFLYRFNGQCQEVKWMTVQNEWLMLDTNKDYDSYSNSEYHPDGNITSVRLELCYYKPIGSK